MVTGVKRISKEFGVARLIDAPPPDAVVWRGQHQEAEKKAASGMPDGPERQCVSGSLRLWDGGQASTPPHCLNHHEVTKGALT